MLDSLRDLIDLAKEHGPITAAWVVLFAIFAWVANKSAKMALSNVRTLLDQSAELRGQMAEQLKSAISERDAANAQAADTNAQARILRTMLEDTQTQNRLQNERLIYAEARADNLRDQFDDLQVRYTTLQNEMAATLLRLQSLSPKQE